MRQQQLKLSVKWYLERQKKKRTAPSEIITRAEAIMTTAVINFLFAIVFGAIALGAAYEKRWGAVPLVLIFAAFSGYCIWKGVQALRKSPPKC